MNTIKNVGTAFLFGLASYSALHTGMSDSVDNDVRVNNANVAACSRDLGALGHNVPELPKECEPFSYSLYNEYPWQMKDDAGRYDPVKAKFYMPGYNEFVGAYEDTPADIASKKRDAESGSKTAAIFLGGTVLFGLEVKRFVEGGNDAKPKPSTIRTLLAIYRHQPARQKPLTEDSPKWIVWAVENGY